MMLAGIDTLLANYVSSCQNSLVTVKHSNDENESQEVKHFPLITI